MAAQPLTWSLRLVEGVSRPSRTAAAALGRYEAKLKAVDGATRRTGRTAEAVARLRASAEGRSTRATVSEAEKRQRAARREAGELEALARRVTATQEREFQRRMQNARRAGAAQRRLRRFQEDEAGARGDMARARGRAAAEQRRGQVREGLSGVGGAAAAGISAILMAADTYANNVQQRTTDRQSLESSTSRLATGPIGLRGDTAAAATTQLQAAVRRTAEGTGIAPTEVLAGLQTAQDRFAVLSDAGSRAAYLTRTLPELARVALATQSPLADVVATAGEMQRQMGISADALPDALAQVVIQAQRGSIGFADMAQHIGGLYGMTGRFMATTGAAGRRSNALTGALFQTAGESGQGADASATMVRGFLANFASARGQGRLRAVLGESALDARGQLRTAPGQTQTDAFIRMVESVFQRTGGNAERFGRAIAGDDQQGRVLADQLFRQLSTGGGRLTAFRTLVEGAAGATSANTQGAAAAAAQDTPEVRRARTEVADFYRLTEGQFAAAVENVRLRTAQVARDWGMFGALVDNPAFRGASTLIENRALSVDAAERGGPLGPARTRRDLQERAARADAEAEVYRQTHQNVVTGFLQDMLGDRDEVRRRVEALTAQNLEARLAQDRARGIDPNRPLNLSPGTVNQLGTTIEGAMTRALQRDRENNPGGAGGAGGGVRGTGAAP